jgi:hypothetical protein
MDRDLYVEILDEELQESIKFYNKTKNDIVRGGCQETMQ